MTSWPRKRVAFPLIMLGICLLTVLLYAPGLHGSFLFDDVHTVKENPWIKLESLSISGLRNAATSFGPGDRELAMVSFAFNHYLFGHSPFAYKSVNLGVHLVTGLLLYLLIRLLVGRLVNVVELERNALFRWMPELVTGLWLVAPINLTSVLYISQRMTSLSAMFVIAGVLLYVYARTRQLDRGDRTWFFYPCIALCLYAAWSCKENGILLVPLLLLVEWLLFGLKSRDGKVGRHVLVFGVIFLVAALVFAAYTIGFKFSGLLDGYGYRPFTLEERLLTQARALIFYIGLVLFPTAGRFGLWHDDFEISTSLLSPPDTLTSLLLLTLLGILAVATYKRYPLCTFGILWFFIGHSMESSVLPLEMIHEHRNYLPSMGIVLTLVAFLGYLQRVRLSLKLALLGFLLASASFNLYARSVAWSNEYRHALHEFTNHPDSVRATFMLGAVVLKHAQHGREEIAAVGFDLLKRARELGDEAILPEVAMILTASVLDRPVQDAWVEHVVRDLLETSITNSDVMALRGLRECALENHCDPMLIYDIFDAAAKTGYGLAIEESARFFEGVDEPKKALETQALAARHAGNHVEIRLNYIFSLIRNGMYEEARHQVEEILNSSIDLPPHAREQIEKAQRLLSKVE